MHVHRRCRASKGSTFDLPASLGAFSTCTSLQSRQVQAIARGLRSRRMHASTTFYYVSVASRCLLRQHVHASSWYLPLCCPFLPLWLRRAPEGQGARTNRGNKGATKGPVNAATEHIVSNCFRFAFCLLCCASFAFVKPYTFLLCKRMHKIQA